MSCADEFNMHYFGAAAKWKGCALSGVTARATVRRTEAMLALKGVIAGWATT